MGVRMFPVRASGGGGADLRLMAPARRAARRGATALLFFLVAACGGGVPDGALRRGGEQRVGLLTRGARADPGTWLSGLRRVEEGSGSRVRGAWRVGRLRGGEQGSDLETEAAMMAAGADLGYFEKIARRHGLLPKDEEDEDESSAGEKDYRWQGDDSRAIWNKVRKVARINAVRFDVDACGEYAEISPDELAVRAIEYGASSVRTDPSLEQHDRKNRVHYFEVELKGGGPPIRGATGLPREDGTFWTYNQDGAQGSSFGIIAEGDPEMQHFDEATTPDDAFVWYHKGHVLSVENDHDGGPTALGALRNSVRDPANQLRSGDRMGVLVDFDCLKLGFMRNGALVPEFTRSLAAIDTSIALHFVVGTLRENTTWTMTRKADAEKSLAALDWRSWRDDLDPNNATTPMEAMNSLVNEGDIPQKAYDEWENVYNGIRDSDSDINGEDEGAKIDRLWDKVLAKLKEGDENATLNNASDAALIEEKGVQPEEGCEGGRCATYLRARHAAGEEVSGAEDVSSAEWKDVGDAEEKDAAAYMKGVEDRSASESGQSEPDVEHGLRRAKTLDPEFGEIRTGGDQQAYKIEDESSLDSSQKDAFWTIDP